MVVAYIAKDHLDDGHLKAEYLGHKGKTFELDPLKDWWISENLGDKSVLDELPSDNEWNGEFAPKTPFKMFDDDGELYYSGWLMNDQGCIVQQFVLAWGTYDSGCTYIEVFIGNEWKQEIG